MAAPESYHFAYRLMDTQHTHIYIYLFPFHSRKCYLLKMYIRLSVLPNAIFFLGTRAIVWRRKERVEGRDDEEITARVFFPFVHVKLYHLYICNTCFEVVVHLSACVINFFASGNALVDFCCCSPLGMVSHFLWQCAKGSAILNKWLICECSYIFWFVLSNICSELDAVHLSILIWAEISNGVLHHFEKKNVYSIRFYLLGWLGRII